jgi:hypothetical protein
MELEEGFNFLKLPNRGGVLVDSKIIIKNVLEKLR